MKPASNPERFTANKPSNDFVRTDQDDRAWDIHRILYPMRSKEDCLNISGLDGSFRQLVDPRLIDLCSCYPRSHGSAPPQRRRFDNDLVVAFRPLKVHGSAASFR
jgi:hypothetical protein